MKIISKMVASIICVAVAQPLYSQTCGTAILASTPDSDFIIHNDGTVTHSPTNLMWKVCSEGQTWNSGSCINAPTDHSWQQALQAPDILNTTTGYAGYSDWRLPNIKELTSIVEYKCNSPAINESVFDATPAEAYWTSTPTTKPEPYSGSNPSFYNGHSWVINFFSGDLSYFSSRDDVDENVRLVRTEQ